MLTRALKTTSDAITEKLMREIRDVGCCTSLLEQQTDKLAVLTSNHNEDLEILRDENLTLQDFINRARKSNIRFQGIPEAILDLQSTITALFQELAPLIPIERLEKDRTHRSLAPRSKMDPEGHGSKAIFLSHQGAANGSIPQ